MHKQIKIISSLIACVFIFGQISSADPARQPQHLPSSLAPKSRLHEVQNALDEKASDSEPLIITDDADVRGMWFGFIQYHMRLLPFARKLYQLSMRYGPFYRFPRNELINLLRMQHRGRPEIVVYDLAFIIANSGGNKEIRNLGKYRDREGDDLRGRHSAALFVRYNLLFITAIKQSYMPLRRFITPKIVQVLDAKLIHNAYETLHFVYPSEHWAKFMKDCNQHINGSFIEWFDWLLLESFQEPAVPFFKIEWQGFDKRIPSRVSVLKNYKILLPEEFYDHPGSYIERQETVGESLPLEPAKSISYSEPSTDIYLPNESHEKIHKFRLKDGREVIAKRINPLRVRYPEEEIEISRNLDKALQEKDERFHAQKFIGLVYDKGAFYLLSLMIPGDNPLHALRKDAFFLNKNSANRYRSSLDTLASYDVFVKPQPAFLPGSAGLARSNHLSELRSSYRGQPPALLSTMIEDYSKILEVLSKCLPHASKARRDEEVWPWRAEDGSIHYTVLDFETFPYSGIEGVPMSMDRMRKRLNNFVKQSNRQMICL